MDKTIHISDECLEKLNWWTNEDLLSSFKRLEDMYHKYLIGMVRYKKWKKSKSKIFLDKDKTVSLESVYWLFNDRGDQETKDS